MTTKPTTCQQDGAVPHVCDQEPMTATPPPGQPATPAEALRRAAARMDAMSVFSGEESRTLLRRWADELDTAPAAGQSGKGHCPACRAPDGSRSPIDLPCPVHSDAATDPGPAAPPARCRIVHCPCACHPRRPTVPPAGTEAS